MDACTIIAKNYVAFARVLAASYLEQHPQSRFHVLIIDDHEDHIDPAAERFEVVSVDELGIDGFDEMAGLYDVLELSTAVKPWLMRHLLARAGDGGGVLYLDPDMRLYQPLTELFAQVRAHDVVLCPHNLEPMPRDGRRPTEQDILIAGVYNLGFLGLRAGEPAERMLDWWSERLRRDCIVDPERGFFVDQRWMDLTPGLTERFHVVRDPGFNVAYWNLSERPVSHRDGAWWVKGDVPLRLFHFSGLDPLRPDRLSKHQDRVDLEREPDLARLCRAYADELIEHDALSARSLALHLRDHGERDRAQRAAAAALPGDHGVRRGFVAVHAGGGARIPGGGAGAGGGRWRARRQPLPRGAARAPARPARRLSRSPLGGGRRRLHRLGARLRKARDPDPRVAVARDQAAAHPGRRRRPAGPVRRQRRGIPALRAGRRRGGAPGDRGARHAGGPDHPGRRPDAPQPRRPRVRPHRGPAQRLPRQPGLRQRGRPARFRRAGRARLLRGPPHDRLVVVGGVSVPRALARLVRVRRRGVGRKRVRRGGARGRIARPGRARAHAGERRARRPGRTERARAARGVRVPVPLRLPLASCGARTRSGWPTRSSGPSRGGRGRLARPQEHQRRSVSRRARGDRAGVPPRTPTSISWTGTCRHRTVRG